MALRTIRIDSILGGWGPTHYLYGKTQYNSSIAIDPDLPVDDDHRRASGVIVPTIHEKFSGASIDAAPMWILTQPKTTNSFVYQDNGKLHSFTSALAMRATDEATTAFPIQITGGAGNGAVYYNNFIYLMEATDVSRYGGMDQGGTIAKTENVWTGATLGALAALTDTTYPSIRGTAIPNHAGHVHGDNSLYFCDVVNGQGVIHQIKTTETVFEGDTNNVSAFNVLDLPFGMHPVDIESFGTDLVILAFQSSSSDAVYQGQAKLYFWDTTASSFYREVPLPDPLGTALLNHNGIIYIWTGDLKDSDDADGTFSMRISQYIGGDNVQELMYVEDGAPPFAGAVEAVGNRLVWAALTEYPETAVGVHAFGLRDGRLEKGLHHITRNSGSGANPLLTSLKRVLRDKQNPELILGWQDDADQGLDKKSSSGTLNSLFRTQIYNIGMNFRIAEIRLRLGKAVAANMEIIPTVYFDDAITGGTSVTTINSTNFSDSERNVTYKGTEMKDMHGKHNFFLELNMNGTVSLPVVLPIEIVIDILDE